MERDPEHQGDRRRGAGRATGRKAAFERSVGRNRVLALAILGILALAAVAPAGQASDSVRAAQRAEQKAISTAERAAERETNRLNRRAGHQSEAADKHAQLEAARQQAERLVTVNANHAVVTIECSRIVVEYKEFPEGNNAVGQRFSFKRAKPGPPWASPITTYSFKGAESKAEIPIAAPMGQSTVVFRGRFATNGIRGTARARALLYCGPLPGYALSTAQSISGPYTTSTMGGEAGETVSYLTTAVNTGNTPLAFSAFSAPGCDHAPAGGNVGWVEPHESTMFSCTHTLTAADAAAGFFANAASVTGTPGTGEGGPITRVSPGLLISPVKAASSKNEVTTPSTPSTPAGTASSSTASSSAAPSTKSGQLAFSSAKIPSLLGPAKCVRGRFTISVKSTGVASVIFYIDGRRLTRRTVHSARKGLISLVINGARLKPGVHHLTATITMVPGSSTAKAVVASRTRIMRRCSAKH